MNLTATLEEQAVDSGRWPSNGAERPRWKSHDHRRGPSVLALLGATTALVISACTSGSNDVEQTAGPSSPAAWVAASDTEPMAGTVWVTNRSTHDVTAFDAKTGGVLMTVPVGQNPTGVVVPRPGGKVYVSNEDSNTVSVISQQTRSVVAELRLPTPNAKPHHLAASRDGRFVYVAEFGSHKVAVIDTADDRLVAEYEAGAPGAKSHAVGVSPDGTMLYVANSGTHELVALAADTGERRWSLSVGRNPSEIVVAPGGQIGYLSVRDEHVVKVVDLSVGALIDEVEVGPEPDTLQLTPDAKTLVIALRGTPAHVVLADTGDLTARRWAELRGKTTGHQWLSADGRHSFVAVEGTDGAGTVGVVDNRTGAVVVQHPYPLRQNESVRPRPHGVFYEPAVLGHPDRVVPAGSSADG